MSDDSFSTVRFNGCLGSLRLTPDEILFQDETGTVTLSWELDSLKDQVMQPVTSSVDLTFDMEGIMERVSFQMTSFAEVARFRTCIAKKRKARSQHNKNKASKSSVWGNNHNHNIHNQTMSSSFGGGSSSLDTTITSLSSARTFHHDNDDPDMGVTFHSTATMESKRRSVITPSSATAMVRQSSLQMEATEPPIPFASRHESTIPTFPTSSDSSSTSSTGSTTGGNTFGTGGSDTDDIVEDLDQEGSLHVTGLTSSPKRKRQQPQDLFEDSASTLPTSNRDDSNNGLDGDSNHNTSTKPVSTSALFQASSSHHHASTTTIKPASTSALQNSPQSKRRATVEPNTAMLVSRDRMSVRALDTSTRGALPRSVREYQKLQQENNKKDKTTQQSTDTPTAITPEALLEIERRREEKIRANAATTTSKTDKKQSTPGAAVAVSPRSGTEIERRRDAKIRASTGTSTMSLRSRHSTHDAGNSKKIRASTGNSSLHLKRSSTHEGTKARASTGNAPLRRVSTHERHEDYLERRREQKLKENAANGNKKRESDSSTTIPECSENADDSEHREVMDGSRGDMDRSSSATVDAPHARRSATDNDDDVAATKKRISFDEDPILALKRSKASTEEEVLTIKESIRGGMDRVTIVAACKTSQASLLAEEKENQFAGAERVNVTELSRGVSERTEKSEKSGELSLFDPTESTMPDVSAVTSTRNSPTSQVSQMSLIEATLVEEGSSRFLSNQIRDSVIASPVDVVNEDSKRRKLQMLAGAVCCCSLLIVVIALVVSFTVGGKGDVVLIDGTENLMSPEELHSFFQERLQDMIYDASSLEDAESPQSKALYWLAYEDLDSQALITEEMDERLHQRFLLAVVYFTLTQEKKLLHCQPSETGETSTCIHPVLESYSAEGIYFDQRMSEPAFRWLSEVEECRWAGVKCEDGVHVSKLQLPGYELQSTLPIEIGYMANLEVLDLQHNQIHGELPPEWGELATATGGSVLKTIRLDRNELSGTIPEEWCQINTDNLQDMVLSNNELTGTLPPCLGDFVSLENFSVLHNSLQGSLPTSIAGLSNLQRLHLAGNKFNGAVPAAFCKAKDDAEAFEASADCDGMPLPGFLSCSCCTTCCVAGGDKEACDQRLAESIDGGARQKTDFRAAGFALDRDEP